MLELQLMKARHHHSIYHLQFAPMFQKSSFFFGELTPGGTGDVGHCIDQIRERLAPKDGIERRQSLQAPEAAENWWVGEGEIFTWRNYSAYFFRIAVEVFVLVNIYDVVSKLNSVEIAICYLRRFLPPRDRCSAGCPSSNDALQLQSFAVRRGWNNWRLKHVQN